MSLVSGNILGPSKVLAFRERGQPERQKLYVFKFQLPPSSLVLLGKYADVIEPCELWKLFTKYSYADTICNSEKAKKKQIFNKYFRFNLENASCHIGISLNCVVSSEQWWARTLLLLGHPTITVFWQNRKKWKLVFPIKTACNGLLYIKYTIKYWNNLSKDVMLSLSHHRKNSVVFLFKSSHLTQSTVMVWMGEFHNCFLKEIRLDFHSDPDW